MISPKPQTLPTLDIELCLLENIVTNPTAQQDDFHLRRSSPKGSQRFQE
jgi:hypothetical protein